MKSCVSESLGPIDLRPFADLAVHSAATYLLLDKHHILSSALLGLSSDLLDLKYSIDLKVCDDARVLIYAVQGQIWVSVTEAERCRTFPRSRRDVHAHGVESTQVQTGMEKWTEMAFA